MTRIEKDKVLRLTPFDACGSILGGECTCAVFCLQRCSEAEPLC
jgi:hypothetical protein